MGTEEDASSGNGDGASPADEQREGTEKKDGRGHHPNSRSNLVMWAPGESGNPAGGSRKTATRKLLEKALEREFTEKGTGKSMPAIEVILMQLVQKAAGGDLKATREILDRLDPKPRRIEVSGHDGQPIEMSYVEQLSLALKKREENGSGNGHADLRKILGERAAVDGDS